MNIHKNFVNQIIFKRKALVKELITGKDSLNLDSQRSDQLIISLDQILYTVDFLEKNKLIKCTPSQDNSPGTLFDGFHFDQRDEKKGISQVYAVHFLEHKLYKEAFNSLKIEMNPGLLSFVNNKYKTDEQIRSSSNTYLAVAVAIVSSFLTAFLTALFGN